MRIQGLFSNFFKICPLARLSELKGAMDKKADGVIWLPFLQFSTDFSEIFTKILKNSVENENAFKSELTPLDLGAIMGKSGKMKVPLSTFASVSSVFDLFF